MKIKKKRKGDICINRDTGTLS